MFQWMHAQHMCPVGKNVFAHTPARKVCIQRHHDDMTKVDSSFGQEVGDCSFID